MANVTIFQNPNYVEPSQALPKGRYDDANLQISIGNDALRSLKVAQGLVARLYEHFHFQGRFIDIKEDRPALNQFWDKKASSIIVYAQDEPSPVIQQVVLFKEPNYGGPPQILMPGKYDTAALSFGDNALSSALIPYGMTVRLYEHPGFQGEFIDIWEDTFVLSADWRNRVSSVEVRESVPERKIEILLGQITNKSDPTATLFAIVESAISELSGGIAHNIPSKWPFPPFFEINKEARRRVQARELLLNALQRSEVIRAIDAFDTANSELARHSFNGQAEEKLNNVLPAVALPNLSVADIREAFGTDAIDWEKVSGHAEEPTETFFSIPGYAGPKFNPDELLAAYDVAKGGAERFRVDLLKGELQFGRRNFSQAIQFYNAAIAATPAGSSRRKLIAMRCGFTHIAAGDTHFRKSRNLTSDVKEKARSAYENAIKVVIDNGVPPNNPAYPQIVDYSQYRLDMLSAGINFLGFRDSFVPVVRHQSLLNETKERIAAAQVAVSKFESYQTKADNLAIAEQETAFEQQIAINAVSIAEDRRAKAALAVKSANIQIDQISRQMGPFSLSNLASVFGQAAKLASDAAVPNSDGGPVALGAASMVAGYFARQEELGFQMDLAKVNRDITVLEDQIAQSEVDIASKRVEFLAKKIAFGNGLFDKDLYFALARFYEQIAERHVETAIRYAYLYERAIAFFLGKPGISHIKLDYRNGAGSLFEKKPDGQLITAADLLDIDVGEVTANLINLPPSEVRTAFEEPPFSLAQEFPLEFNRFLQTPPGETARMNFVISFYQLSKRRPDCHKVRIKNVLVKIPSVAATANFAGTLTHWGRFLVRDKQTTLQSHPERLIPTTAELEEALRTQREGDTAQVSIDGVIPYALEEKGKPLGIATTVNSEFAEFTLTEFEGYGPAGAWQLELRNTNLRDIVDVTLSFVLEAAVDPQELENEIEPLIKKYEAELARDYVDGETMDHMKVFSLKKYAAAFAGLATGVGTFELKSEDFDHGPFNGDGAKVRTVVAQVRNTNGGGVQNIKVEISKPGTAFLIARTTLADGFSVDLSQGRPTIEPPEKRPAGAGTWQVRLPEPAQFADIANLILFFVYDFG